jgi:type VI secretion system protein ImpJ
MANPSARVRWSVGQVLLPEHFRALEASLSTEAAARIDLLGLPTHGVARLEWNGDDLRGGVLYLHAARLVLHSGELVDVPDNAEVTAPLDLRKAGRNEVAVYLHVLDDPPPGEETVEPAGKGTLPRVLRRVELSDKPSVPRSRGRIKLADFVRQPGGSFAPSPEYVPPLVQIGPNPWLVERLRVLSADLGSFAANLGELVVAAEEEGEPVRAPQRARIEAIRLGALLDDLGRGVAPHPYMIFAALRSFLLELHLLEGSAPEGLLRHYDHDDLGGAFGAILRSIEGKLAMPPLRTPCVPLVVEEGRFVGKDLPAQILGAHEVYLLIQRSSPEARISLEHVRIASPGRLRAVHERVLRGVRATPVARPPFRHGFGPSVDVFRLAGEGDSEWRHVVEERALCFYQQPQLAGARAALFWRRS